MTNPNLVNTSQVYMKTVVTSVSSLTPPPNILENTVGSNNIIRIDTLTICNTTAGAISVDAYLVRSSTLYAISKTIEIPAYSSLIIVDKDYPIYLEEGDELQTYSPNPGLQAICSYTVITDYVPQITTSNLLLYLDAADSNSYPGTGTTWSDLSGNGYDGTLTNGPVYNSTYFDFDGDNDYVEFGTIPVNDPLQLNNPSGGGMSIMFAVWFDGSGDDYQRIIAKSNGGIGANGWSVYRNRKISGDNMIFSVNGSNVLVSNEPPSPVDNVWQIWTVTYDQSTSAANWYYNGQQDTSGSSAYSVPNVETGMRLGTWNHSDARELNGRIGFFMVYDKVLSESEITGNFQVLRSNYGL